ncbi:putative PAP-specific phosphatase, mitochondrial isoform X5 [Tripterygium wilfordii]|uniref:putative PAP-specific phosphatase, mitochondrial isoform X5 n=1 Tax=Tripterygium wilfordii TaxID=458696 RepID=UPI0018F7E82F|nr:putative PAP-specific phosphatase, mitochondrial isoform X5 [Tripterygium wilfordii]
MLGLSRQIWAFWPIFLKINQQRTSVSKRPLVPQTERQLPTAAIIGLRLRRISKLRSRCLHFVLPWIFSILLLKSPLSDSFAPILLLHVCAGDSSPSSLPFPNQKAKYHRELEAAVEVKSSLFSAGGRILEKNDQTPVTVADFGVQALVSLELGKIFPSIPLVAEEDSAFLRSNNLVDSVVNAVTHKANIGDEPLTNADVLEAIDRGAQNDFATGSKPATYWVLDPIDGTKGFLKGNEALYVVGLAFIVEGEIVLGVMGCPNWQEDVPCKSNAEDKGSETILSSSGIIMVAHVGCGTWMKRLAVMMGRSAKLPEYWTRCLVDKCQLVHKARFCIPESQTWASMPLSASLNERNDASSTGDREILLLSTCCGSLCKYLMVASGKASVFILRVRSQTLVKAWDHAVGIICVHEAGGKVTDWRGSELDFAADQVERRIIFPSGGVLVTNGNIHSQIMDMISSVSTIN